MTRAFPDYGAGEPKKLVILQNLACYMLLACGLLYVVSVRLLIDQERKFNYLHNVKCVIILLYLLSHLKGILCIGCLKRYRQKQEITREQAAKDLEVHNYAFINFD